MDELVTYELHGTWSRVTLNDPSRGNPLTHESVAALINALDRAAAGHAQVVVLKSTGWAFSVGGDLKAFAAASDQSIYVRDLAVLLHRAVQRIHSLDAIVVAVVQGMAAGAGFPLALAGDVILASPHARFTLGYTKVGLTPDGGATLLARTLGRHHALRLALFNDVLDADTAHQLGLVAQVIEDDHEMSTLIERLAAGPAQAQVAVKRLVQAAVLDDLSAVLDREAAAVTLAAAGAEGRAGVAAFHARTKHRKAKDGVLDPSPPDAGDNSTSDPAQRQGPAPLALIRPAQPMETA